MYNIWRWKEESRIVRASLLCHKLCYVIYIWVKTVTPAVSLCNLVVPDKIQTTSNKTFIPQFLRLSAALDTLDRFSNTLSSDYPGKDLRIHTKNIPNSPTGPHLCQSRITPKIYPRRSLFHRSSSPKQQMLTGIRLRHLSCRLFSLFHDTRSLL